MNIYPVHLIVKINKKRNDKYTLKSEKLAIRFE